MTNIINIKELAHNRYMRSKTRSDMKAAHKHFKEIAVHAACAKPEVYYTVRLDGEILDIECMTEAAAYEYAWNLWEGGDVPIQVIAFRICDDTGNRVILCEKTCWLEYDNTVPVGHGNDRWDGKL